MAQSNALVKYCKTATSSIGRTPPGSFTLITYCRLALQGDLLVVVKEADGREQSFTVPFSAVPNMLKQGVSKYGLVAGKVNQADTDYAPAFAQGTLQYGFNNLVTGYVGTILSEDYRAWLLGSGWNLPFGAVSVDVTQASTHLQDRNENGQSFRIAYSKFWTLPQQTSRWRHTVIRPKVITALTMPYIPIKVTASVTSVFTIIGTIGMTMSLPVGFEYLGRRSRRSSTQYLQFEPEPEARRRVGHALFLRHPTRLLVGYE